MSHMRDAVCYTIYDDFPPISDLQRRFYSHYIRARYNALFSFLIKHILEGLLITMQTTKNNENILKHYNA